MGCTVNFIEKVRNKAQKEGVSVKMIMVEIPFELDELRDQRRKGGRHFIQKYWYQSVKSTG